MASQALGYVPLLALGLRLGAPNGVGQAFFEEHRAILAAEHGPALVDDLAAAMTGDEAAARRFADALVPGGQYEVHPPGTRRADRTVAYRLEGAPVSGEQSSPCMMAAELIAGAAIALWDAAGRPRA